MSSIFDDSPSGLKRQMETMLMQDATPAWVRLSEHQVSMPVEDLMAWSKKIRDAQEKDNLCQHIELALAFGHYETSSWVSRDKILVVEGEVFMHPWTALVVNNDGRDPLWTRYTIGCRELERDRRLFLR